MRSRIRYLALCWFPNLPSGSRMDKRTVIFNEHVRWNCTRYSTKRIKLWYIIGAILQSQLYVHLNVSYSYFRLSQKWTCAKLDDSTPTFSALNRLLLTSLVCFVSSFYLYFKSRLVHSFDCWKHCFFADWPTEGWRLETRCFDTTLFKVIFVQMDA